MITKSGREIEADAVVIGAGVNADVMLARGAGLELGESGGIRVDAQLQTADRRGVRGRGRRRVRERRPRRRRIRVEHWDVAFNQGKTVAQNMLGAASRLRRRALLLL